MDDWSDADDEAHDAGWRDYHLQCCKHGDGWSHGFTPYEWVPWPGPEKNPDPKPPSSASASASKVNCNHTATACAQSQSNNNGNGNGNKDKSKGKVKSISKIFTIVHEPQLDIVRHFTTDNWRKMGDALTINPVLKFVDLSHCGINAECIAALFGTAPSPSFRRNHHHRNHYYCPLEKLTLGNNPVGASGLSALLPFLRTRSAIKYLNLNSANLDVEGARLLGEALNHTCIDYLHLRDNEIGDEGVEHILSAGNKSNRITELCLVENVIGQRGCEAIARFLSRDDTDLKKLFVNCHEGEHAKLVIDSISNKSKLQDIFIWGGSVTRENETIKIALPNVQNLVCDTSSPEALCNSNHQMKWLGMNTDAIVKENPTVRNALDINARSIYGAPLMKIIRCKLRTFYFQGEYDFRPLAKIDLQLMPNVLELLTKTEICEGKGEGFLHFGAGTYSEACSRDLGSVYWLVRNCHLPELFSFVPLESNVTKGDTNVMGTKPGSIQEDYVLVEFDDRSSALKSDSEPPSEQQPVLGKTVPRNQSPIFSNKRPKK